MEVLSLDPNGIKQRTWQLAVLEQEAFTMSSPWDKFYQPSLRETQFNNRLAAIFDSINHPGIGMITIENGKNIAASLTYNQLPLETITRVFPYGKKLTNFIQEKLKANSIPETDIFHGAKASVAYAHQGQGLGTKLMKAFFKEIQQRSVNGTAFVFVSVREDNVVSSGLIEKFCFQPTGIFLYVNEERTIKEEYWYRILL